MLFLLCTLRFSCVLHSCLVFFLSTCVTSSFLSSSHSYPYPPHVYPRRSSESSSKRKLKWRPKRARSSKTRAAPTTRAALPPGSCRGKTAATLGTWTKSRRRSGPCKTSETASKASFRRPWRRWVCTCACFLSVVYFYVFSWCLILLTFCPSLLSRPSCSHPFLPLASFCVQIAR